MRYQEISPPQDRLTKNFRDVILIVDDDWLVLKALEATLKREGYEVLTASNGKDAIDIIEKNSISVIICDQRMPGISGIEVLTKAIEIRPNTIRILLTANADIETAIQAINIGQVSQFLAKPWDDTHLRQIVRESMEKYRLIQENQNLHNLILFQHHKLAEANEVLRQELLLGKRIHEELLIAKIPEGITELSIETLSIPSKEIDGDFFEFFQPTTNTFDVILGDVMGKGLPAALVGTAVKTELGRYAIPFFKTLLFETQNYWQEDLLSPAEILEQVQKQLVKQLIHLEYFVCLFYARFNFLRKTLVYTDCGATKPLHYRASQKKIKFLSGSNFSIGMVEKDCYKSFEINYEPDDIFIFYSDGLTEALSPNKEAYGIERLIEIIQSNAQLSPKDLLHTIKQSVCSFVERDSFDDDLTLIVLKINPPNPAKPSVIESAKFLSELSQLKAARMFIARLCNQAPGDKETLSTQLTLAINELFCNIVVYGKTDINKKTIIIKCELGLEGLTIDIADQGEPFNPSNVKEPSLSGDKDNGYGLYIVKEIVDKMTYTPKASESGWNHFRIFKKYLFGENEMEIRSQISNNTLVLTPLFTTLDAKDSPEFKEKINGLITNSGTNNVVLDLSQLKFIDSSGLGAFLSVLRTLHTIGGELKLACMGKSIRTIFELVSMHKIFEIFNSTEDAVKSFQLGSNAK